MKDDLNEALEVLRSGGVILYPTDTIWGLGCDATNKDAVSRIYEIKQREDNKSMIVLMDQPGRMYSYIDEVPEVVDQLLEFAEKPLTLILEGAKNLASNVVNADDGSIGIRIAKDNFCQQLIQRFKKPIVSTSANVSGQPSAAIFDEISDELINAVDYVVKYRQDDLSKTQASSIIKIGKDSSVKVIRE